MKKKQMKFQCCGESHESAKFLNGEESAIENKNRPFLEINTETNRKVRKNIFKFIFKSFKN